MATEQTATFVLRLKDEISSTAQGAAGTLSVLRKKLDDGEKSLGGMQRALRVLKGDAKASSSEIKLLQDRITAQKAANASLQRSYLAAGGSLGTQRTETFTEALARQGGVAGATAQRIVGLQQALSTTAGRVALGINLAFGLVTALLAVGAAAVAAAAAIIQYGLAHADARRNELLHLEGLTLIRSGMGLATGSASELQAAIDRVSATSALGRSEISGYAERLHRMGLRGEDLTQALEGTAITASVLGDRWASRFAGMTAAAIRTGGSVRALADDVRGRLGGVAARQAIGLTAQLNRLREGLGGLFDRVDIEPLLRGLDRITSLFSRGSVLSEAWGRIFGDVFGTLIGGSEDAGGAIAAMLLRATTAAVRFDTFIIRINTGIRSIANTEFLPNLLPGVTAANTLSMAWNGLTFAGDRLWLALQPPPRAGNTEAFLLRLGGIADTVRSGVDSLADGSLGTALVDGLVTGIAAGRTRVVSAIASLATEATTALQDALGIRSPSRVFARLGVEIPRGVAMGVETGTRAASSAVDTMGAGLGRGFDEVPAGGAVTNATSSTSIGPFYLQLAGDSARAQAESLRDQLAEILEGLVVTRGGTPA
jgi:hypothetical protein